MCQILLFMTIKKSIYGFTYAKKTKNVEQINEHQILQAFAKESNFKNLPF
jgi:hypothetical protein